MLMTSSDIYRPQRCSTESALGDAINIDLRLRTLWVLQAYYAAIPEVIADFLSCCCTNEDDFIQFVDLEAWKKCNSLGNPLG